MKQQLLNAQKLIQDDLLTYLNGASSEALTTVCEIVVNRFKPLLNSEKLICRFENKGFKCTKSANHSDNLHANIGVFGYIYHEWSV